MTGPLHHRFTPVWQREQIGKLLAECGDLVSRIRYARIGMTNKQHLRVLSIARGAKAIAAVAFDFPAMTRAMVSILDEPQTELAPDRLRRVHWLVGHEIAGDSDATRPSLTPGQLFGPEPGKWRRGPIMRGAHASEADTGAMLKQLTALLDFLNQEVPPSGGGIVQAIVAHACVKTIQPFNGGNGRTGAMFGVHLLLGAGTPQIAAHAPLCFYRQNETEYAEIVRRHQDDEQTNAPRELLEFAITGFRDGLTDTLEKTRQNNQTQRDADAIEMRVAAQAVDALEQNKFLAHSRERSRRAGSSR